MYSSPGREACVAHSRSVASIETSTVAGSAAQNRFANSRPALNGQWTIPLRSVDAMMVRMSLGPWHGP